MKNFLKRVFLIVYFFSIFLRILIAFWKSISKCYVMITYLVSNIKDYFSQGLSLSPLFIVLLVGFSLQFLKVIIDAIKSKAFHPYSFVSSGGFPSFHTGLSSSVTMYVLLVYGVDSIMFMIVFCFALLFAYDAMNLRYEAGQHAHYINDLRSELQDVLHQAKKRPLKERIGHTPLEVFGGVVLGSLFTYIFYYLLYLAK